MRIVGLEIERVMGIRRLVMDFRPHLQLIAGPNNSGKTTIFRALEFFFNPDGHQIERIRPQNDYYRAEGRRALTRVRVYFGDLTDDDADTFDDAITARSREFWVEVRMSRAGRLSFVASRRQPGRELHARVLENLAIIHVPAVRVGHAQMTESDAERLAATLKDVVVRSRPGRDTGIQRSFIKASRSVARLFRRVLEGSEEHITELALPGVNLEFTMPPPTELVASALHRIQLRRSNTNIELSDEGTGIQSLLSLGILRFAATRDRGLSHVFLIEEPEAFLHPQLQRAISDQLDTLSRDAQVIATTHSPIIIDANDFRNICRLPRDPSGLRYEWTPPEVPDAEAALLRRYCDAKNSEFIFARRVVFCEGPSDTGALRSLLGSELDANDVAVIAMGSADVAEHFVKIASRFKVPHLLVFDKDRVTTDTTTLRKVARAGGRPLTAADDHALSGLTNRTSNTPTAAAAWRHDAQVLFGPRNVYCLGNDIEGAVAYSYPKNRIVQCLGPANIGHLSQQSIDELQPLRGRRFRERLRQLVGSKGWNNANANNHQKLKPHVPKAAIAMLGRPRTDSDLAALARAVRAFMDAD